MQGQGIRGGTNPSVLTKKILNILTPEPVFIGLLKQLLLVYLLFSVCRIGFYLFNASLFQTMTVGKFFRIMLAGLKFDTVAILYVNILYILVFVFPLRFRYNRYLRKTMAGVFFLTNGLALLANVADFIYFQFTLRRTTMSVFKEFSHETNMVKLSGRFIIDYWPATLFFIGLMILLVWGYRKVKIHEPAKENFLVYYSRALVIMGVTLVLFIAGVRGGFRHSTRPITLSNAGEYVTDPKETHIVLNTPFCILKTYKNKVFKKVYYFRDEVELDSIYNPVRQPHLTAPFKKYNVVIFILESFGRENVGFFNRDLEGGKYKGYTPFLDSLCQHSLAFWNGYANGRKSIDAIPSVLSSIPFMKEPYVLTEYYDDHINSLGSLLKEKGYYTAFFHGAPNGSMGFSSFVKLAGIDHYYGMTEYGHNADFDGTWGIWDEPFFQFFRRKMDEFPQPFFSTIFSVSSHHPFELPAQFKGKFPEGPHPIHRTFGYTDYALREFFRQAANESWFNNTIFVLTADHTQTTPTHDVYLTSTGLFEVPIIFYIPREKREEISYIPMQQIDIMPTILGMLNFDKPYFSFGFDVFHDQNKFVVNYQSGVYQLIQDGYVLQFDGRKSVGLYNLGEDPLLKNNLVKRDTIRAEQLERNVKAFIQQFFNRVIEDRMLPPAFAADTK